MERGFTYFDTAYMYHEYEGERATEGCACDAQGPRQLYAGRRMLPVVQLKEKRGYGARFSMSRVERCGVEHFRLSSSALAGCGAGCKNVKRLDCFVICDADQRQRARQSTSDFPFHDSAEVLDQILTEHPEAEFVQLQLNYLDWEDGAGTVPQVL